MTALYQSRHGAIAWCKQPTYKSGLRTSSPASFEATGAGSTTTIVSATLGGDTADDWVGKIVEVVRATNEQNVRCRAMVIAFDPATDTLTLDAALPAATADGDRFRLYDTPDGLIVATSAVAGGATVVAAGRGEADDYWNGTDEEGGYRLEAVNGDNVTTAQNERITDFAQATGTFTLGTALGVDVAVGDMFRAAKHPQVSGIAIIVPDRPDITNNPLVGGYGAEKSEAGNRSAAGAVELLHRGPGRTRAGSKSEADEPLSCVFTTTAAGGDITVDTGATTTSIPYSAGSPVVGQMGVTEEGDVFMVAAVAGGAITPSPPLRTAPVAATTIKCGRVYTPANTLQGALTVYNWLGSALLRILYGTVPLPKFAFERGGYNKISFGLKAADYYEVVAERGWYPRLPTVDALRTRDMRLALYDGSASFAPPLIGGSFDPQIEMHDQVNLSSPNEIDGQEIINVHGAGTFKTRLNSTTARLLRDAEGRRELTLLLQSGAAPGSPGMMGIWAYSVGINGVPPIADGGGELESDIAYTVNRNATGLALGLPQFAIALF